MGDVEPEHATDAPSFAHHPIRAGAREAAHLREVADAGESPATPAIIAGALLAFLLPLAAALVLLDTLVEHFT